MRIWVTDHDGKAHRCSATLANLLEAAKLITQTADGWKLRDATPWASAKAVVRTPVPVSTEPPRLHPSGYLLTPWLYPLGEQRTISKQRNKQESEAE